MMFRYLLIALLLIYSDHADARVRGSVAGTFSGGKIQAQAGFLAASGEYPYINYFKKAQRWDYTAFGGGTKPSEQDAFGYPTTLATSQWYTVLPKPTQASIGNPNWVLRWTGNSTLFIQGNTGGSVSTVFGSLTGSGGAGYYEFSTTEDSQFKVGVGNLNGSTVGAIELYRKDQETARNAGEIFNPDYINIMRSAKIAVLRFLDYQDGNKSNITTWATRKTYGYYSYAATEYRSNLYLPTVNFVANNGTDYSATGNGTGVPASGAPTHGLTIHINPPANNATQRSAVTYTDGTSTVNWTGHPLVNGDPVQLTFDGFAGLYSDGNFMKPTETLYVVSAATNTFQISRTVGGSPLVFASHPGGSTYITRPAMFDLNGTGKVVLADFSGVALPANSMQSGNYITFVYDSYMKAWLNANLGNGFVFPEGIGNGVPVEDMLALATKIGAHPHFVSPVYALHPSSDWATQFATYVKNNSPLWMIPRFETPNETFNTFAGFGNGPYLINLARLLWNFDSNYNYPTGRALRILGQQVGAVYGTGNLGVTYDVLLGVQSVGSVGSPTTFRTSSAANNQTYPRASSELADGYMLVNINASNPTITVFGGGNHGKSIGSPIFFNPTGNNMPSNLSARTKYYVANNANFSLTGFDITTVPGGGSFGQAGIVPGTGGNAPYAMIDGTAVMPSSVATTGVYTNYINPTSQNKISESTDAINYYVNDNSVQKAARMATYVTNNTVTSGVITGSISGTTLHVTSISQGDVSRFDSAIVGTGVTADTYLTAQLATQGADVATFSVNNSQTVAAGTTMRFAPLRNYYQAWGVSFRNLPIPMTKTAAYEGGWSPDFANAGAVSGNLNSVVTGVTNASPAVLTLSNTNVFGNAVVGANPAVVGGYIQLANLTGGYATYNGRIVPITNVSGSQVTVTLDTSAQGSAFSGAADAYFMILAGTATASISGTTLTVTAGTLPRRYDFVGYGTNSAQVSGVNGGGAFSLYGSPTAAGSQTMNVYTASINFINDFRGASKNAPELKAVTTTNYNDLYAVTGASFPSVYYFAGTGNIWPVWDPDIYVGSTPVQWQAVQEYNFLLKRDLDPASNDNDPMFLEKAA